MNDTMLNGKVKQEPHPSGSSLPSLADNPFLRPAWPKSLSGDISPLPWGAGLTKEQRAIYDKGGAQLIKQHFQRIKTVYAIGASAQVEDLANRSFVQVGTNIVLRKRANPYEELAPYLDVMMDAQLLRMGQELNSIASDHARTQNQIASDVVEIDDESLRSFWDKLLRGVNRNG